MAPKHMPLAEDVTLKPEPPAKMRLLMNDSVTQKMLEVDHQSVHSLHCNPEQPQCTVMCICVRHVIRTESTARATEHNNTECWSDGWCRC